MKSCRRAILSTALVLAVELAIPGSSTGQPMDLDTPPSSPLWWTLTDAISPVELRKALRDPEAHLARYRAAVEAGVADVLPEEQVQTLSFYYNRDLTPELTPMWVAFSAFATGHLDLRGEEHATEALTEFGFSPAARAIILQFGASQHERSQEIVEDVREKSLRFVEIQRKAIEARGGDRRAYAAIKRAAERGDLGMLLGSTDVSLEALTALRAAWLRNPITETAEELLPELRSRLSPEDWGRFRRFLLEHVVVQMGNESKDFDYAKGIEP